MQSDADQVENNMTSLKTETELDLLESKRQRTISYASSAAVDNTPKSSQQHLVGNMRLSPLEKDSK